MVKTKKVFGNQGEVHLRPEMNLHFWGIKTLSFILFKVKFELLIFFKIEWYLVHMEAIKKMHHNLERACFSTCIIVSWLQYPFWNCWKISKNGIATFKMWFGVAKCLLVGDFGKMVEISWHGQQKSCVLYSIWLSFREPHKLKSTEVFQFQERILKVLRIFPFWCSSPLRHVDILYWLWCLYGGRLWRILYLSSWWIHNPILTLVALNVVFVCFV